MKRALILSAILFTASTAQAVENGESDFFKILGWTTYGVIAGDLASTEIGISQGAIEANPLMRNRAVRISSHAVVAVVANHATARLHRAGHEKMALWMRIAMVAGYGYIISRNMRQF